MNEQCQQIRKVRMKYIREKKGGRPIMEVMGTLTHSSSWAYM